MKTVTLEEFIQFCEKLGNRGGFEFSGGLIWDRFAGTPLRRSIVDVVLFGNFEESDVQLFFKRPDSIHERIVSHCQNFLDSVPLIAQHYKTYCCEAVVSDKKEVREPDLSLVRRDEEKRNNYRHLENPFLIIEVSSDSTLSIDLSDKVSTYQNLSELQTYIIVWQGKQQVLVYQRIDNQKWEHKFYKTYRM
ncbi:MAG: Uma2 family endonuclease [Flammeovirgaceae bacterium]|nr:Uma2 family endonuclease [Flammeovirgaceae bacterium]MDW8287060.1 Uma2 family endonuclease [Flammeovirgaceae bacterium]